MVDHDPRSSTRLAENLGSGAPRFLDHRELIGPDVDVDAALVLTPDDTHAEIAIDLLEAGISVYLEKPLATTVRDADAVLVAAQRTGGRLYVGHNMRHMAVVRTMRDLIAGGAIGVVKAVWCRHFVGNGGDYYFKDWHTERSRSNGLLLQKGAHDIDVIHWLAGGYTTRVAAMGGRSIRLVPAVPLHAGLLAELHRHRHSGSSGELRRHRIYPRRFESPRRPAAR